MRCRKRPLNVYITYIHNGRLNGFIEKSDRKARRLDEDENEL